MTYLFHDNDEFKYNLSKKFLNIQKNEDLKDIVLISRNTYIPSVNRRIIPDMILYSKSLNKIAIIEIKILSGQGLNQLQRYEDGIYSTI